MGILSLIDGAIRVKRPPKPLPYAYFENDYAPAVAQLFDLGAVCKDVYIKVTANTVIRFNDPASDPILINPQSGVTITNQWANKVYVTFTNSPVTHMVLLANG